MECLVTTVYDNGEFRHGYIWKHQENPDRVMIWYDEEEVLRSIDRSLVITVDYLNVLADSVDLPDDWEVAADGK